MSRCPLASLTSPLQVSRSLSVRGVGLQHTWDRLIYGVGAIDYRFLNKFCTGDAFPTPDISDLIQRVGISKFITSADVKGAYWQIPIRSDHQWLTAFVWDGGLYEFTRAPFG